MTQSQKYELELLKAAVQERYDESKGKWRRLLKALYLSPTYVPAIQEILGQGKWRNQTNPIAYVRKAAVKRAVQRGIVDTRRKSSRHVLTPEIYPKGSEGNPLKEDYRLISELCQFGDEQEEPANCGSAFARGPE